MIITYIHRIGWFIGLVLLQVLILNNVHIAGYATPFLKYTTASVFVHSLALLSIEFFSFSSIWLLLLRVLLCTILTVTCIVAVEGIRK